MHLKNGICHPSNHRTSGRNPSGDGLGGRNHPPPPSEAMMAIRQLRKVLLRRLLGGESVKQGYWGSFSVTISSTGADTKEDVTARNIKNVNLNFQPDEAFKNDLQKVSFA